MAPGKLHQYHPLAGKHIIVAGGGIAGLAFVRGLARFWPKHLQRPTIAVYERDPRKLPVDRGNYSLGLRSDSRSGGLQALQKLGLVDEVYSARVPGSEEGFMVRDSSWTTLLKVKKNGSAPDGLPTADMRITRNSLRECLLQSIPEYGIEMHWEVGCNSAATLKDGRIEVGLSDSTTAEADLLIVADGASSKIRGCLRPDDNLRYAGVVAIGGNARFSKDQYPEKLREGLGMVIGGNKHAMIMLPIDDTSIVWFVTDRKDDRATPLSGSRAVEKKDEIIARVLKEGAIFGDILPTILSSTDASTLRVFNAMDKEPVDHSQTPQSVIYIGDANHAMSPFAGNGANMALMDGASLGETLSNSSSIAAAAAEFDKDTIPRSKKSIKSSHMMISWVHSTGVQFWLGSILLRILNWFIWRK